MIPASIDIVNSPLIFKGLAVLLVQNSAHHELACLKTKLNEREKDTIWCWLSKSRILQLIFYMTTIDLDGSECLRKTSCY